MFYSMELKNEKGISIIELVITFALALIGIFASFAVMVMQKDYLNHFGNTFRTQRESSIAMKTLKRGLKESSYDMVQIFSYGAVNTTVDQSGKCETNIYMLDDPGISTSGDVIVFPSARDDQGFFHTNTNGIPVWQKYMIYYIDMDTRNFCEYVTNYSELTNISDLVNSVVTENLGKPIIHNLYPIPGFVPVNFQWDVSCSQVLEITIITGAKSTIASDNYIKLKSGVRFRN